ncbi:BTAD domain-containing putative transcriptional regulator [Streptomyces sp. NPDC006879]|uniref:BTAD domain-containing putative transcriptional regulator n=1 Tax=Streptomyces sp. NPDC006879 TaxID=3364767 RepID=UPI0036A5A6CA
MRYGILGTAQALQEDGTAVALGGARLRALLTALALRPGRPVSTGVLVDEVWGADPPADASGALQALVGRLRRSLGRTAIASGEGSYRLVADRGDVDVYRFERLVDEAAAALAGGDPALAVDLYTEALAQWRGPACSDLPGRAGDTARWEAERRVARRGRLGARFALGEAEELLPELAALCREHPLDEPLQALRMRALRAAGRPAEALQAYEAVRHDLAHQLGTDPGPELVCLHAELLNPTRLTPTPERARATPEGAARPEGARRPSGNLRARLTTFVGRETDITAIGEDLRRARLVTLLGPGGAGKTRLCQEAAETVAAAGVSERWPDGVWLVELAPVDDPDDVPEAVLSALGARETKLRGAAAEELRVMTDRAGDNPVARLMEHCARRRMLLLLDNCEHVVTAAAHLAEELLARCPGVQVLATSREPLGVAGESLRPVEPLPAPMALQLLADRGAAARPGFTVAGDPDAAAEICRRLDGLPLAIELAAARLRLLTARQIADRLDDRFRLLTSGSRTALPRQQTLRAVVDWSWDLLDKSERAVLGRLSVFAGGCDLAAAEEVCAGPLDAEALDVPDVLGSLVDRSLVVAAPDGSGQMRYRLLETVAEYAAERLATNPGDHEAAERRHLVYYRELARANEPLLRGPTQRTANVRMETEYENLRTAMRRAAAAGDEQEMLCFVHCLAWYWNLRELRTESRHWSEAAAALGPDPFAAPIEPALPVYEQVVDQPPPYTGELLVEARRGVRLVQVASRDQTYDSWRSPEARTLIEGILATYRPGLPQLCRAPGGLWIFVVMIAGDQDFLQRVIDATIDTARELGYDWDLANALQIRANVLANRTEWGGDATRDAEESLEIYRRLADDWGAAEALSARGEAHERRGEFTEAVADFREAIEYAHRLGAESQVTLLRVRLAGVLGESGQAEDALEILQEVVDSDMGPNSEAMPPARMFLAMWLGRAGRIAEAREQLIVLREEFAFGAYAIFDCFVLGTLAWLDNLQGRYSEALTLVREALEKSKDPLAQLMAPQMSAHYLMTAAGSYAALGGTERALRAARLLGAQRHLLPVGHFEVAMERDSRQWAEELSRAVLGEAAFEAARAEGGGLTLEEATALV